MKENHIDIFEEIVRLKREGLPAALATIVQSFGSSPQKEGAKMLVLADGSLIGTLGGGCLEAKAADAAMKAMSAGTPVSVPFSLTETHGDLACGGRVLVYIEPLLPSPRLIVLGAGHVGQALCRLARFAGFRVTVVDDRPEYASREQIPEADEILVSDFGSVFADGTLSADRNTFIVVATRGHQHDQEALHAALAAEAGYVGLLGSRRKRALLFKKLAGAGFTEEATGRVHTPVGMAIGAVTPEEIAVSIVAQLIEYRRKRDHARERPVACGGSFDPDGTAEAVAAAPR